MLSKSQISFLNSLQQKKSRKTHSLFLVEGIKSVTEFIHSEYAIDTIYYTPASAPKMLNLSRKINFHETSAADMAKFSSLTTPQEVIALVKIRQIPLLPAEMFKNCFSLMLDGVQDPGNLGTIIRTADWFGINNIICSLDTVDAYNPKVVQAAMGSLAHVNIHYLDIIELIKNVAVPVFGALLDGESIFNTDFGSEGIIIMGNEGNGMRAETELLIQKRVTIPSRSKTESLNVAIATAIFCSELYRKTFK